MQLRSAFLIALVLCSPGGATTPGEPQQQLPSDFDRMKKLVGTWQVADNPTSSPRIEFSLTARGTVLVEEWTRHKRPHSMTLYHRDGGRLIATHYCPQGNQPRLQQIDPRGTTQIRFKFLDATDLDPVKEAYLTNLAFDLRNLALLVRQETYRQNGVDEPSELRLIRVRCSAPRGCTVANHSIARTRAAQNETAAFGTISRQP